MKISRAYLPTLLAALLAAAGVQAQTSSVPPKAGEASTYVQGRPNVNPNQAAAMADGTQPLAGGYDRRQDPQAMGAAPTSKVPLRAGEASTVVEGRPNINPNVPALNPEVSPAKTRAEVVAELLNRRAAFEAHRQAMLSAGTTTMGMLELPPQ
jgi:hypothetical protein